MRTAPQSARSVARQPRKCRQSGPTTKDILPPVLEHPNTRSWFGTAHNNALAKAAMIETEDKADTVVGHLAELTLSPMFRLLVEDFREGEGNYHDNPGFNLAQFAARCFFAGTLYKQPPEGVSTS
jgi:hypothetical protein